MDVKNLIRDSPFKVETSLTSITIIILTQVQIKRRNRQQHFQVVHIYSGNSETSSHDFFSSSSIAETFARSVVPSSWNLKTNAKNKYLRKLC